MKVRGNYSTFAVVNMNDLSKVDFSQVGQTSADTVRKNLLSPPTQFILKWEEEPTFISDGTIIILVFFINSIISTTSLLYILIIKVFNYLYFVIVVFIRKTMLSAQ